MRKFVRMGVETGVSLALFAMMCGPAAAQSWRAPDGTPGPSSESRKEIDGFSAMLLVTPDMDWQDKWGTPPDVIPHFREADRVARDERLAILIFFANPAEVDGNAHTVLDLKVIQPNGEAQLAVQDVACFNGPLLGHPTSVRLCETSLGYIADPDDLSGQWRVEVVVKDRKRNVEIPLRTSFEVLDPGVRAD